MGTVPGGGVQVKVEELGGRGGCTPIDFWKSLEMRDLFCQEREKAKESERGAMKTKELSDRAVGIFVTFWKSQQTRELGEFRGGREGEAMP